MLFNCNHVAWFSLPINRAFSHERGILSNFLFKGVITSKFSYSVNKQWYIKILLDIFSSAKNKIKYKELGFNFKKRRFGESKLSTLVVWEYILQYGFC